MFIVRWEGGGPDDKAEWIAVLREVLAGELGSYRVCFVRAPRGWRLALECRPDSDSEAEAVISNSPESVAFNIRQLLLDRGKPLDPDGSP